MHQEYEARRAARQAAADELRAREKRLSHARMALAIAAILLGWLGAKPAEGGYVLAAQILTAYYFFHFLILLPILGLLETPRERPASIAEAVLKTSDDGGAAPAGCVAVASCRSSSTWGSERARIHSPGSVISTSSIRR